MKIIRHSLLPALLLLAALPAWAAPQFATWTARMQPGDVRAGEGAQIVLTAKIQPPWHLYSLTQPPGGPLKTTLELVPGGVLTAGGAGVQPPYTKMHDAGFNMTIQIYSGTASFGLPVKVKAGVSGPQTATVNVRYQLCNASSCLPPKTVPVTVTFVVAKGAARPNRTKPVTTVPKAGGAKKHTAHLMPTYEGTLIPASDPQSGPQSKIQNPKSKIEGSLILVSDPPSVSSGGDAFADRVNKAEKQGLLPFLLLAIGAGFTALLTPCVFPMIPITVSFFTKRKDETAAGGVSGAIAYCVGIIATFTLLGLFVTAAFGASGISRIATNPLINIGLAVLYILLAANLFGMFEIAAPTGLANRVQSQTRRGGIVGPMLMGLAFTLTSFTCTVPFVGTVLVTATHGNWFYPTLGMIAFSSAFALPFFLLALFPQYLSRLPKSGSWLVSVKAFMGFLELAAALKFLSNADLVWQRGLLTRPVFLALWAMIGVVAGLYLLGGLRLPHDMDTARIGWRRRLIGGATVVLGVYCLLAMNGTSLGAFDAYLPPSPYPGQRLAATSAGGTTVAASNAWLDDYDKALALAKQQNKPIFINFTGVTCTNCRLMENTILPRPDVVQELNQYVKVELYTDRGTPADDKNQALEQKLTNTVTLPVYVALDADGKVRKQFQGLTRNPSDFVTFLQQGRTAAITTAQR